jgi:hypothetical protein
VQRAGFVADLGIKLHAHMLRRSTGYNDALMMLRLNMADPLLMSIAAAVALGVRRAAA